MPRVHRRRKTRRTYSHGHISQLIYGYAWFPPNFSTETREELGIADGDHPSEVERRIEAFALDKMREAWGMDPALSELVAEYLAENPDTCAPRAWIQFIVEDGMTARAAYEAEKAQDDAVRERIAT